MVTFENKCVKRLETAPKSRFPRFGNFYFHLKM